MHRISQLQLSLSAAALASCLCATEAAADDGGDAWHTAFTGYFRAPLAIAIANRPDPGPNPNNVSGTQLSFGPDRAVDGTYSSFAFTRLQETDWAEVYVHEKKEHVDGAVGWGGSWFQAVGFQQPFATWVPGFAYIRLDGDFDAFGLKPNVALQIGSFWPRFGYFPVYDTYTMGRIHQLGERIDLTVPVNRDLKVTLTHGLGGDRNGFVSVGNVPVLGLQPSTTTIALDLLTYVNLAIDYKDYVHVGLHGNYSWTSDPGNSAGLPPGATFADVKNAHLTVAAAEARLSHPQAGSLWVSPTYIQVKNGWALDPYGGVEVMHSQGGGGFAANYMGSLGTISNSTGSGSTFGLGFLYANTLGGVTGRGFGAALPDLTLNVFGLMANSTRDLSGTTMPTIQTQLNQFKWGTSLTLQTLKWLGVMIRFDQVNNASPKLSDLGVNGNNFSIITPRLIFSSNFISSEVLYLQYSRYFLGSAFTSDPNGTGLYINGGAASDVVKMEATMAW